MKKVILVIICLSFMVCSNVYGVKQELKGVKIVLDAGHGGFDNGTILLHIFNGSRRVF